MPKSKFTIPSISKSILFFDLIGFVLLQIYMPSPRPQPECDLYLSDIPHEYSDMIKKNYGSRSFLNLLDLERAYLAEKKNCF